MPSGAKKRKAAAAKKKQGKFNPAPSSANTTSTTVSTQGDEDLKHHESRGHNAGGEEGVEKSTEDVKNGDVQIEKEVGQDDGDVQGGEEPKQGNELDQKKEDSSSSSSSSSDSDDGSREVEKKVTIVENAPVIDVIEAELLVPELNAEVSHATTVTKLDDPVAECVSEVVGENILALGEEVLLETGASVDSYTSSDVVELGRNENEEPKLSSPLESAALPEVTEEVEPEEQKESEVMENAPVIDVESVGLPEVTKEVELEEQKESEVVENAPVIDVESVGLPEVTKEVEPEEQNESEVVENAPVIDVGSVGLPETPEEQKESEVVENAPVIDLVEAERSVSELPVEVTHTILETKLDDPVAECESEVVGENILEPDEKVLLEIGASTDSSTSPGVIELGQKENGDMKSSTPIESAILPEVQKELAAESKKDEENDSLLEVAKDLSPEGKKNESIDVAATSEADVPKNEEKLILSYNAPRVETTVDAEDVKESEVLGSVDSQACATSTVESHQTTSWKSCCGLFEAFSGTSR